MEREGRGTVGGEREGKGRAREIIVAVRCWQRRCRTAHRAGEETIPVSRGPLFDDNIMTVKREISL